MSDALRERIIELLPRLRRFAHALTGSRDLGDDLVQDTCERALAWIGSHAEASQLVGRLDSWMFKIARNIWIDRYRSNRTRGEHVELDDAPEPIGSDGRHVTESRLTLEAVGRGIDKLPDDLRVLVVLVCIDGATYEHASQTLEIPIGTVMSRLSRARRLLHASLSDVAPGAVVGQARTTEVARGRTH